MISPVKSMGYTLIEMVVVIIIIGVLATVAMRSMDSVSSYSRTEETKAEMARLARAVTGQPDLISGGMRTDFGYVGDIGALPANWDDLVINPGYSTWHGPYIRDDFTAGGTNFDFKIDGWGKPYGSPNSTVFSSSGGPETISMRIANSLDEILCNRVRLVVTDRDKTPPGNVYSDSVLFRLSYPDGAGGITTATKNPSPNGLAQFDSIPIGKHNLETVFLNTGDTLATVIVIHPGSEYYDEIQHFEALW